MPIKTVRILLVRLLPLLYLLPLLSLRVRADKIDDYIRTQMERNHIPAVSVAVIRNGNIEKKRVYGTADLEWNAPATTDTAFQLASATKPLTGTALMLLVQEGKISLEDSVTKYLPDAPTSWKEITIRHLISHSAGIKDDLGPKKITTAEEGVRAAYALPLEFVPGERSTYGISGYIVLMHIMEKVTGKPFEVFLRERLLQPLGMDHTQFEHATDRGDIRAADAVPHRASVYSWEGDKQRRFWFLFGAHAYSAGGLFSTVDDLAKWTMALDSGKLLNAATLEQMWTKQPLRGGATSSFGAGWVIGTYRGRKTVGHSGGPALADILRFVEGKLTIIVLANQQNMYPYLAQGIADLIVPAPPRDDKGIADTDAATTERLKQLLTGFGQGKIDASQFSPEAQRELVPALNAFAMPFFRSLEPVKSLTLIEDKQEGEQRIRRYRVWYGSKPVLWKFELTQDGKVASLEPSPE